MVPGGIAKYSDGKSMTGSAEFVDFMDHSGSVDSAFSNDARLSLRYTGRSSDRRTGCAESCLRMHGHGHQPPVRMQRGEWPREFVVCV